MENLDVIYRNLLAIGAQLMLMAVLVGLLVRVIGLAGRLVCRVPALAGQQTRIMGLTRRVNRLLVSWSVFGSVLLCAVNAYYAYRGVDLIAAARQWAARQSAAAWQELGVQLLLTAVVAVIAPRLIRLSRGMLVYLQDRAKGFEQVQANDASIERFFQSLIRIAAVSVWLAALIFALTVLPFPDVAPQAAVTALKLYLIIAIGVLAVKAVAVFVDTVDALSVKYARGGIVFALYASLKQLVPLLRRTLEYVLGVWVATLALLQVDAVAPLAQYGPRLMQLIVLFFLCRVFVELSHVLLEKFFRPDAALNERATQQRVTIVPLIQSLARYAIYFGTIVLMLRSIGVNPAPILAGAGVMGLVVGLGAQSLINDIVSGFFILFESHYLVGDFIETGTARGVVESIEIRTTRIRNPNGQLHILRNGHLGEIINYSKGFTHAVVPVGVDYSSDLDKVFQVIGDCGRQLARDNAAVLEPTRVDGLEDFGESELTIRTVTKVKPGAHAATARQLRKLIKEAFDREGIEIPFARRVVIMKSDRPAAAENASAAT